MGETKKNLRAIMEKSFMVYTGDCSYSSWEKWVMANYEIQVKK